MLRNLLSTLLCWALGLSPLLAQLQNAGAMVEIQSGVFLVSTLDVQNTSGGTLKNAGTLVTTENLSNTTGATLSGNGAYRVGINWTNSASFAAGSSSVTFDGAQNSAATSGGSPFYNVSLNKSAGFHVALSDAMSIANTLHFQSGDNHLLLGNFNLSFGSVTGFGSDRYITTGGTGKVSKNVSSAFTFPVGFDKTAYNPLTLTQSGTPDVLSVRCLQNALTNGATGAAFTQNTADVGWDVLEQTPGGSNLAMQFQWSLGDELPLFNRASMSASRHDGANWQVAGAPGAGVGSNPYQFSISGITASGVFVLSDQCLLSDDVPPTISCPVGSPFARNTDMDECSYTVQGVAFDPADFGDNCPGATVKNDFNNADKLAGAALPKGSTTIIWTVTDGMNMGTATCSIIVVVTDNQPPTIICPNPATVTCASDVPAVNLAAVSATDNCPGVTKSHVGDVTTNMTCANRKTVTRTYKATDASNNTATCAQVITVFDNVAPNFTSVPANVTVQCNSIPAVGSPTASDGCGGSVGIAYNSQTVSNQTCTDRYTLTRQWTATDACGNTKTATQRINVIDTQKPAFVSVPANVTVQCDAIPNPATPTATDNCDTDVAITYNGQTQTNGACPNAYTLTRRWTAEDNCGNTVSVSQRISVVDNGKPTLTIPADMAIACSDPIPSVGTATASDGCAGAVTIAYLGQSTTSGACPGSYQIKRIWRATDACGNTTAATQTIQVSDNSAPVFVTVPGPLTIECNQPLPPLTNPTASDACGGYVHITFLGNVATGSGCENSYTITRTWRAQDLCGNTAMATQVITVVPVPAGFNPQPPVVAGFNPQHVTEDVLRVETRSNPDALRVETRSYIVNPNPTTDRIRLDLTDFAGEAVTVSIFTDLGQLVWENRIPTVEDVQLQISLREAGAAAGIYTVSVRSVRGVVATRVVLVE